MGKTKQLFRDPDHPRVICPVQLIRDFVAVFLNSDFFHRTLNNPLHQVRHSTMTSLDAPSGFTRPVVFFDVSIGETPAGRIKMGELA